MYDNRLLQTLERSRPDLLHNRVKLINFVHGDMLAERGMPIEQVVFPCSGLVSLVVELADGDRIEVGMVGVAGAVGGAVVFGEQQHLCTSFAQIPGRAWTMRAADAIHIAHEHEEFRHMLFAQERYLLVQAQQTAACNAKHTIMRRLCSWLLRTRDTVGSGELLLTQEYIAQMLGVQRASVSMFASQLQQKGYIQYRRGRVHIADPAGLASEACECHKDIRQHHGALFPPPNEQLTRTAS
jgi:CRP-like cAMP-binding protein